MRLAHVIRRFRRNTHGPSGLGRARRRRQDHVRAGVYDVVMRSVPTFLALLSFPAGAIAYAMTVRVLEWMDLSGDGRSILMLFVPLFVAGLVMMPFLIPFIDRKA